ncbi:MAG: GAF domain-containing protein [Anaerolineales bacterium]|nr:GAF domain-containing protein [Anaerolineales bacterium]
MTELLETPQTDPRASLELLYHISREIAATLDLPTVLQRVLFLSMRTIGAISGSIIVLDDSGNPVESAIIHKTHVIEQTTEQLRATLESGLAGWVVRQRQAVLIPDTSQEPRWLQRPDDAAAATGPKSAVSAPFLVREHLAGVLTLVHPEPGFFNLDHLALVQAIADQAAVAVLNARLYAESRRQARVMTAVAESAAAITASLHLDDVLQQILDQISQALHVEAVSLALIDPQNEQLEYYASTSPKKVSVVGMRLELGQGIAGWVAKHGRGVIVPDARQDARFYPGVDQRTGFQTRAVACAPIHSRGEIVGILEAINPFSGPFNQDALVVLSGIGGLAGSAIRHAQLFERLEAAHQRYRDLFEDNADSILITDLQSRILEANRQTVILSGFGKTALEQLRAQDLHAVHLNGLGVGLADLQTGAGWAYESTLQTKTGLEVPVDVNVHAVQIEGQPYLQWTLRDITERKQLDQLREDLLSSIYHDLRSPLANVVSSIDVLGNLLSLDENPALKSLFNIAVRSTERIQRLTNSLLDINRLEAGQPVVNLAPVAVETLVQDALEAVGPIAHNKEQQVEVAIQPELPQVQVDGDMIRRVIINLLENAIKFSPPQGRIQIGARQEQPGWIQVWVADTGPGIPVEKRHLIFDKFTRLHGKSGPAGIGLGLAYCRLAVEGHGGQIAVQDAALGGAHFTFNLPVATPDPQDCNLQ